MDRLSQLQDLVFKLEELICISIDELRRDPKAVHHAANVKPPQSIESQHHEHSNPGKLFAKLIVERSRAIEQFIGFLPTNASSGNVQNDDISALQRQNTESRAHLEQEIFRGEALLKDIQSTLATIVHGHHNSKNTLDEGKITDRADTEPSPPKIPAPMSSLQVSASLRVSRKRKTEG
eukprot:m.73850 g.73850  ORF g.73850 m.73850 type:complete len:178 (+) comp16131_c0_seq1:92-625(+)